MASSDQDLNPTVLEILTRPNADLDITWQQGEGCPNTMNSDYVKMQIHNVYPWEDFTFGSITEMFQDLLLRRPEIEEIPIELSSSQEKIWSEENVDEAFRQCCVRPIKNLIKDSAAEVLLRHQPHSQRARLPDISFQGKESNIFVLSHSQSRLRPDWSIYSWGESYNPAGKTVLVFGDSKLSTKWKSTWLAPEGPARDQKEQRMWPLRQIATYCILGNTRYGFLVTPAELVAVRVFTANANGTTYGLQYKSIPWHGDGPNALTIHLVVWALAMMASSSVDRKVMFGPEMRRIDAWYPRRDPSSGRPVYEHHLTGQKRFTPPRHGVIVDPQTPGGAGIAIDNAPPVQRRRSGRQSAEASTGSKRRRP